MNWTIKKSSHGLLVEHTHVPRGQFSLEQICFTVQQLLLDARTGFRAASRVVQSIVEFFPVDWEVPQQTTGRTWLLRIALYQLKRPKPIADDWIWIVDHTIQFGKEKCFVILGVRRSELPEPGVCLRLEDLTLLSLFPVTHSDKYVVQEQLEATVSKTGRPQAILGDHGGDLLAGVKRFCADHPETCSLYDVAHKAANLLKARLEKDEAWKSFGRHMGKTKRETQQTEWAFLVPPAGRVKARYMNLGPLLRWARQMLWILDEQPQEVLCHGTPQRLEEKFGWLRAYRASLAQWSEYEVLLEQTTDEIRRGGYRQDAAIRVALRLQPHVQTDLGRQLKDELLVFVENESAAVPPGQRLPGSSEIIESSFGKLKSLLGDHQTAGFTSLLLGLGALVGRLDRETIRDALVTVPWKHVRRWIKENLGTTFQAKRQLAYRGEPAQ